MFLAGTAIVATSTRLILAAEDSAPLSAFVWWLIPLFGFLGAIAYVIWISKFQTKYENQTNRSVDRFQKFQKSLDSDPDAPRGVRIVGDKDSNRRARERREEEY